MRATLSTLIILLASLAMPVAARAQKPQRAVPKEAVAHFNRGRDLQTAEKWDEAIAEYRAAQSLAPRPKLLFNIAQCLRLKGDSRGALEVYQQYLAAEPEGPTAEEARGYVATLRPLVEPQATATGTASEVSTAGAPAHPSPVPTASSAALTVAAPGGRDANADAGASQPRRGLRIAAYALGGTALAATAAGVFFGIQTHTAQTQLDTAWSRAVYDRGRAAQTREMIAFGVAGAALAGGVVCYLVSRPIAVVSPTITPGGGGLSVSGRF